MEPVGLAASIITLAGVAAAITASISKLRAIYELPGSLHAINNEVADLEVVLLRVADAFSEHQTVDALIPQDQRELDDLVARADARLNSLRTLIDRLLRSCAGGGRKFASRAKAWTLEKHKVQELREDLNAIKGSLQLVLGARHLKAITRVELDVKSISFATVEASRIQTLLHDSMNQSMLQNRQDLQIGLRALERGIFDQFSQLQSSLLKSANEAAIEPGQKQLMSLPSSATKAIETLQKPRQPSSSRGVLISATQFTGRVCVSECGCNCHIRRAVRSPDLVEPILGRLFVSYVGMPVLRSPCNDGHCKRRQAASIAVEFWFPLWFLAQAIRVMFAFQPSAGPQLQLRTFRRVPDSAKVVAFALDGNIEGMRSLFVQGLASMHDVSETRNFSVLRWAVYANQLETCKFLIESGADTEQDDSSDRMWDLVLQRGLTDKQRQSVHRLLDSSDYIENLKLPMATKIVLNLSYLDLEKELMAHPLGVFEKDGEGRTALCWAAGRGDEHSMAILLSRGADPGVIDKSGRTPLYLAADEGRGGCARLLLEAGAPPDPVSPPGIPSRSTPLLCAAMTPHDQGALQTLLTHKANVNARSASGETPLIAVARCRTGVEALLLLDCGADINACANNGRTPLTTAIAYNNHSVIKVFLDRWASCAKCPRLTGPELLIVAADFADVETIEILAAAEHLKMRGDRKYVLGTKASERIQERPDVSDDLCRAFKEFLDLISDNDKGEIHERALEAGLLGENWSPSSGSSIETIWEEALQFITPES